MACTVWNLVFGFPHNRSCVEKTATMDRYFWNRRMKNSAHDVSDLDSHWSSLVLVFDWNCPLFISLAVLN